MGRNVPDQKKLLSSGSRLLHIGVYLVCNSLELCWWIVLTLRGRHSKKWLDDGEGGEV